MRNHARHSGYLEVYVPPERLLAIILIDIASYSVIALLHVRRIRQVPLSLALKAQER